MTKIKQSETVFINRGKISFAPYNPRKKDKKVIEALKKNFKKVGFLGGIQWNKKTGNLIGGHKRLETLDLIYGYDGTKEKDYQVKVEQIELDEKTEKEQNIFLNNKRVQGETDYELMAELVKEIDIEAAGLEEYDINLIESLVPNFNYGESKQILHDINELKKDSNINHVKDIKNKITNSVSESQRQTHFIVTFKTYNEKAEFLESIGLNGDETIITGDNFISKLYA